MANLTSGATSRSSSSSASFSSSDYYEESWSEFHERMQSAARARSAARMERTVDTIVGAIEARVAERDRAQRFHQQRAEFEGVAWWLASGNESGETFGESDEWNGADSKARPRKAERRRGLGKLMKWCGALKQTARKVKERLGDWRGLWSFFFRLRTSCCSC